MTVHVTSWPSGVEFLQRAEAFLVAQEVENNVLLAIANQHRLYPASFRSEPYLATVEGQGEVLAAAVMTPPNRLLLGVPASAEALRALAVDVHRFVSPPPGAGGPLASSLGFAEAWQAATGQAFRQSMLERLYQLTAVTPPAGVPGAARRAGGSDRDLLIEWSTAFDLEAFGTVGGDVPSRVDSFLELSTRALYLWEDGRPVSMAGVGGFTPHGARIGPVFTPPAQRSHGYASALTARLSQHLLDGGRQFCCLFTDQSNLTSNHIYQTIGYMPVCDVADYQFMPAAL